MANTNNNFDLNSWVIPTECTLDEGEYEVQIESAVLYNDRVLINLSHDGVRIQNIASYSLASETGRNMFITLVNNVGLAGQKFSDVLKMMVGARVHATIKESYSDTTSATYLNVVLSKSKVN